MARFFPSGGGSLQKAYNSGQSITIANGSNKPIVITNNDTTNNPYALDVANNSSGVAVRIKNTIASLAAALAVEDTGGGDGRTLDIICRRGGAEAIRIQYPTGSGATGLNIDGGSGTGIKVSKSGASVVALEAAIPGTASVLKITGTTDTPTVSWGSAAGQQATTTPAGYMKINVGGGARYIPFWV